MTQTTKPDKRLTRAYLESRTHEPEESPPLTPEQAKRELGFDLLPFNGGLVGEDEP